MSAVLVSSPGLARFQWLYVIDALSFVLAGRLLPRGEPTATSPIEPAVDPPHEHFSRSGYRRVMADSAFRRLCLVQLLLVVFGYAQFPAALPIYLSRPGG